MGFSLKRTRRKSELFMRFRFGKRRWQSRAAPTGMAARSRLPEPPLGSKSLMVGISIFILLIRWRQPLI